MSVSKSRTGKSGSLGEDTRAFVSDKRNQTKHDALCEQVSLSSQAPPCFHRKTKADWHQKKAYKVKPTHLSDLRLLEKNQHNYPTRLSVRGQGVLVFVYIKGCWDFFFFFFKEGEIMHKGLIPCN